MVGVSYGQALPDQVERISTFFDSHVRAIEEVRDLYKDRAALEKEYASKLQVLARKAEERKGRLLACIVVGEDPTKNWDDNTLKQSTLGNAYSRLVDSLHDTAQDHNDISDALSSQVLNSLKNVERKSEEQKKKSMQFYQKLLFDRDRTYSDRLKSKQKYDEECGEVETHRQKQSRAGDDRHAERAARQADQQRADMLNSKNSYLVSTAIANGTKAKFYAQDLPSLEEELQKLQGTLVSRFTKIVVHAQTLLAGHLDTMRARVTAVEESFRRIEPPVDQAIFVDHNIRPFTPPMDWSFEPCTSHYDTSEMSVESAPKIILQNKLSKCRVKLSDLGNVLDSKRKEVDQLAKLVEAYSADKSLGNVDEVTDSYLDASHQYTFYKTSEMILKTEIDTIISAIGDDEGAQQPHAFKSSSFSIPTQCGYCKSSIWGLSKQGKTCKACGLSVHAKCELKVPAECSGVPGSGSASVLSRKPTNASSLSTAPRSSLEKSSPTTPLSASSFVTHAGSEEPDESYPAAKIVFDFSSASEFELSVAEGTVVYVVEPDDGSGWVKVSTNAQGNGKTGLVPASYIEAADADDVSAPSSAAVPAASRGTQVRALYTYQATGADEVSLTEGEVLTLTTGPSGGQNYADGWWEGTNSQGQKGIFPSNYVEVI